MATSIFNSLLNMVDSRTIGEVSQALGQPAQAVSRGMEPSIACLLSGLTSKSDNPGALRKILDTVPADAGTGSWSQIAKSVSDPDSSWMTAGKQLLSSLFGGGESTVINGISRASGLPLRSAGSLLTMAAPFVMSFISRHVANTGMNMNGLASLLQRESSTFRSALPAGLSETFWPAKTAASASPVIAQTVQKETTSNWLLPALAAAALALGFLWLFGHAHRPAVPQSASIYRGSANRFATPTPNVACTLPAGVTLTENGAESRLFAYVQDPSAKLNADTWFSSGRMLFDSGSARLSPGAQTELNNIATILTSCPNVHMTIAGYTDSVGNPQANLRLSQNRANVVVSQLVNRGVSRDRLAAEGYGEQNPVGDDSTAEGRAQNRRVAMRVTQK